MPSREICNGKDDDCDGKRIDNGVTVGQSCTVGLGRCAATGTQVCGAGGLYCNATPGLPLPEMCNGEDDDSNGLTDDNVQNAPPCPLELGVCTGAHQRCEHGAFVTCGAEDYGPFYDPASPETKCDDKDNNCDGRVDEGYVLRPGDIVVSELVPCPAERWCDAPGSACGLATLPPSGNGVAFDAWPGSDTLNDPADNSWIELRAPNGCAVPLSQLSFDVAGPFVPGLASDSNGGTCNSLPADGFCVLQAPASFAGPDGAAFSRTVIITAAATIADEADLTVPLGCDASCRTTRDSDCYNEAWVRSGGKFVSQKATPLQPSSAVDSFFAFQPGASSSAEVFPLDDGMADANGDGTLSGNEDGFIEIEALSQVSPEAPSFPSTKRSGPIVAHTFSCWAPLAAGARLATLAAARPCRKMLVSSVGATTFDLNVRGTSLILSLDDNGVNVSAAALPHGNAFAGGSRESQILCGESYTSDLRLVPEVVSSPGVSVRTHTARTCRARKKRRELLLHPVNNICIDQRGHALRRRRLSRLNAPGDVHERPENRRRGQVEVEQRIDEPCALTFVQESTVRYGATKKRAQFLPKCAARAGGGCRGETKTHRGFRACRASRLRPGRARAVKTVCRRRWRARIAGRNGGSSARTNAAPAGRGWRST